MEKELFDWEECDVSEPMAMYFYNVVLRKPIGEFDVGARFEHAFISFGDGVLKLSGNLSYNPLKDTSHSSGEHTFQLKLRVTLND